MMILLLLQRGCSYKSWYNDLSCASDDLCVCSLFVLYRKGMFCPVMVLILQFQVADVCMMQYFAICHITTWLQALSQSKFSHFNLCGHEI